MMRRRWLHGCRKLVSRDVRLIPRTGATYVSSIDRKQNNFLGKQQNTSSRYGPYKKSYKRAAMEMTKINKNVSLSKKKKFPQFRQTAANTVLKLECLVIVFKRSTVNLFWRRTHRPSPHENRFGGARSKDFLAL